MVQDPCLLTNSALQRRNAPNLTKGLRAGHAKQGTMHRCHRGCGVHCGWGRAVFWQTFSDYRLLANTLLAGQHRRTEYRSYVS